MIINIKWILIKIIITSIVKILFLIFNKLLIRLYLSIYFSKISIIKVCESSFETLNVS